MTPDQPIVPSDETPQGPLHTLGRFVGIGVQFGAVISLFALAGHWLDGRLGSSPWGIILGVGLGFFGGTLSLLHAVGRWRSEP
jgi:F0F1-type ATP synthase assembly protein I